MLCLGRSPYSYGPKCSFRAIDSSLILDNLIFFVFQRSDTFVSFKTYYPQVKEVIMGNTMLVERKIRVVFYHYNNSHFSQNLRENEEFFNPAEQNYERPVYMV